MVKQGDIILLNFDPSKGHEQQKTRPALVVSNNAYNKQCNIIWVCPISHANEYPLHIPLPDGLKTNGKVLCEHIRGMDIESRTYKYLESVPASFMTQIAAYLHLVLNPENS